MDLMAVRSVMDAARYSKLKEQPRLPYSGRPRPLAGCESELQDLISSCRAGRISNVVAWIQAGKALQVGLHGRKGRARTSALTTAVDTGQHDLVRLLLAAGFRPDLEPRCPLALALSNRRWDLVDLLLEAGADPKKVEPEAVFGTYNRELIERFFELGADFACDGSLAEALAYETRNLPLYGFVKNHTNDVAIQREVDLALGCAIGRKNDKAVSLCLWAGANPRHSVPIMGEGHEPSDDWTMTAFERAVWSRATAYLKKLGFDPDCDDIEPLYAVAYRLSEVEALAQLRPPADWHPVSERVLDHALLLMEFSVASRRMPASEIEGLIRLGGSLGTVSAMTKRRLRRSLRGSQRDEARRHLRRLERLLEPTAFLDLVGHSSFLDDYRSWGIGKRVIDDLAEGKGGTKSAAANARRVLRAEQRRPPSVRVPENKADFVRLTREDLYDLVWSMPMVRASKRFGLSDNGLRKTCRKLDVPTPPRGFWAGGRPASRRQRLPPIKPGWPTEAWLPRRPQRGPGPAS